MLLGRLALADAPVELAEAEVTMGDEEAHAEFGGQRESLMVAGVRGRAIQGLGARAAISARRRGA
jgi:hypothetical protein